MTDLLRSSGSGGNDRPGYTFTDRALVEFVDALVVAVDLSRWSEIDRLREALEPFGAVALFDAELRLNGIASSDGYCICGGEEY